MGTPGMAVLRPSGMRGLHPNGMAVLFNPDGTCATCCPRALVLASYVTNAEHPVWDLTPYQGPGMAEPWSYWRLIEVGTCYPNEYPWYDAGYVNQTGQLYGLQTYFETPYFYNGYMELQIGRPIPGDRIEWPGLCQTITRRSM
ncbi:MAG: hypothetical protein AAB654_25895 [Acidobacteriota bacterium]